MYITEDNQGVKFTIEKERHEYQLTNSTKKDPAGIKLQLMMMIQILSHLDLGFLCVTSFTFLTQLICQFSDIRFLSSTLLKTELSFFQPQYHKMRSHHSNFFQDKFEPIFCFFNSSQCYVHSDVLISGNQQLCIWIFFTPQSLRQKKMCV